MGGVSVDPNNIDDKMQNLLFLAAKGGPGLTELFGTLVDQQKAAEAALAELQLGKDTRAANERAVALEKQRQQENESAIAIRAEAAREAAKTLADSKIEADRRVATATASANAIVAQAQETHTRAQEKETQADTRLAEAEQKLKDAKLAEIAAQNATARANAEVAKFMQANNTVKTTLQQVAATL
jgi:hypothetical protein